MPRYKVSIQELHENVVEIEANSKSEAREKVANGEYDGPDNTEFKRVLDPTVWPVEVVKPLDANLDNNIYAYCDNCTCCRPVDYTYNVEGSRQEVRCLVCEELFWIMW